MWWTSQNLARPISDSTGRIWHFRVWHDFVDGIHIQRLYFWDESFQEAGCAEFAVDQTLHVSKLKQRIQKLVKDPSYRGRFVRELAFPVERHYS
jgi:hypothetical protein